MEHYTTDTVGQADTAPGVNETGGITAEAKDNAAPAAHEAVVTGALPDGMAHLADRELRIRTETALPENRDGNTDAAAPAEGAPENGSGAANRPLADPAELELAFPEGLHVDEAMVGSYRQFCVDCGLTAAQAQQAADFYCAELGRRMAQEKEATLSALREGAWGHRFEEKLAKANYATHVLDRQLGGRLRPLLAAGLGNNGVFAEMMAVIGEAVSEDAFSPQAGAYASSHRQMTTEEYLKSEVFND